MNGPASVVAAVALSWCAAVCAGLALADLAGWLGRRRRARQRELAAVRVASAAAWRAHLIRQAANTANPADFDQWEHELAQQGEQS